MPDQARAFGAHPMIVPTVKSRSFSTVSPPSMLNSLKGPGMSRAPATVIAPRRSSSWLARTNVWPSRCRTRSPTTYRARRNWAHAVIRSWRQVRSSPRRWERTHLQPPLRAPEGNADCVESQEQEDKQQGPGAAGPIHPSTHLGERIQPVIQEIARRQCGEDQYDQGREADDRGAPKPGVARPGRFSASGRSPRSAAIQCLYEPVAVMRRSGRDPLQ